MQQSSSTRHTITGTNVQGGSFVIRTNGQAQQSYTTTGIYED